MSACHSLRSHSPLKKVFGKIGDTYQAYCHTYKTHAMATHHGGSGQASDRDINAHNTTDTEKGHAQNSIMTLKIQKLISPLDSQP